MDGLESERSGDFDIGERIVNEQAFPGGAMNSPQGELENSRVWLDEVVFTGDDQVIEDGQEIISMPHKLEFFHREIAQKI